MNEAALSLGYLIPEFPGQTHVFFWREIEAIRALGARVVIFSTRRPPSSQQVHSFAASAMKTTEYLFPPRLGTLLRVLVFLVFLRPRRLCRAVGLVFSLHSEGWRSRCKLFGYLVLGADLAWRCRARRITHLHVHSAADSTLIAVFARTIGDIPYSVALHGDLVDYGADLLRKFTEAEFVVAITEKLAAEIKLKFPALRAPNKVLVLSMGVDTAKFVRKQVSNADSDPVRLCTVARLNRIKRQSDVVEAVAILRTRGIKVCYRIVGDGPARSELEEQVAAANLGDVVQLLGPLPEEKVIELLEATDVFVLASTAEPLGVALMEAMAMEVPVVATNAGGVPELVDDQVSGLLVPPKEPLALANSIEQLVRDAGLRRRLGIAGRRKVVDNFDSRKCAKRLFEHILEVQRR